MRLPLPKLIASTIAVMYKLKEALVPAAISTGAVAVSIANKANRSPKAIGSALVALKEAVIPNINVISTETVTAASAVTVLAGYKACDTVRKNPKATTGVVASVTAGVSIKSVAEKINTDEINKIVSSYIKSEKLSEYLIHNIAPYVATYEFGKSYWQDKNLIKSSINGLGAYGSCILEGAIAYYTIPLGTQLAQQYNMVPHIFTPFVGLAAAYVATEETRKLTKPIIQNLAQISSDYVDNASNWVKKISNSDSCSIEENSKIQPLR